MGMTINEIINRLNITKKRITELKEDTVIFPTETQKDKRGRYRGGAGR